jgi:hypothetical protein
MTVSEYVTRFTQLSCYTPDNVDTDEKKQDWFLNDLNDGLAYALEARDFVNFQDMVDEALVLENRRGIMEHKRKMQHTRSQGSNMRFRVGSSSQGPNFHSGQQRMLAVGQGFQTLQRQIQRNNIQSPHSVPPPSQRKNNAQNTGVVGPCYSCGQSGHYANVSKKTGKSDSSLSHKSERQLQCQQQCIYSSKEKPSSCSCESCGNRRCSSSSGRYHWYDSRQ